MRIRKTDLKTDRYSPVIGCVITPELSQELRHFVTYHNLLSHEYHGITRRDILAIAGKSAVIREFVTRVRELVRDTGKEDLLS